MKRLAFNGGEVSPELALRSDLDVYHRACSVLENFDVSQMGGIKRRRGMRFFAEGHGGNLFCYEYTVDETFLVEVGSDKIWVYDTEGTVVYEAEGGYEDPMGVQALQVNAIMLFASGERPLMELSRDAYRVWRWQEFGFKHAPMRYTELRDRYVRIEQSRDGSWKVEFDPAEDEVERTGEAGDVLRVGVWTGVQEGRAQAKEVIAPVIKKGAVSSGFTALSGQLIVVKGEKQVKYYSCIEDWRAEKESDEKPACYVKGLSHPANYAQNFVASEEGAAGKELTPIKALGPGQKYSKGDMLAIETAYWEYYTCVKDFNGATDYRAGAASVADYPEFFMRGVPVGEALQCRGTWKFFCSGGWIGEYEVKRNYKSGVLQLGSEWESCGSSFSPFGATMNTAITGDESDEECFVRLFITRSYCLSDNLEDGFPADSCENRLIVDSYKHYVVLHYSEVVGDDGEVKGGSWSNDENMALPVGSVSAESRDWSWGAFSRKYGYPRAVELHEKRLVLAGTTAQPLTIWMSANDDLNNFEVGEQDDDGIALTIAGKTQNPICWLMSRDEVIVVGASNAEYIIRARTNGGALTGMNATCSNSGYHGSAMIPAVRTDDRILYVQRRGKRLYEIAYNDEFDAWRSKDMTVFASHVLDGGGGVIDGCYLQSPDPRAVFVLADGTMALLTYNSLQEVNAWQRYTTEGRVMSCAAMAHRYESDSLFFLVMREEKVEEEDEDGDTYTSTEQRFYIEVIDEQSVYEDNGGRDYVSTVVTNALTMQEAAARKGSSPAVYFYLGEETEVEGLEVSVDGEVWRPLDRNERTLGQGWQQMVSDGGIHWEKSLGLRVRGNRGLSVLAMQS